MAVNNTNFLVRNLSAVNPMDGKGCDGASIPVSDVNPTSFALTPICLRYNGEYSSNVAVEDIKRKKPRARARLSKDKRDISQTLLRQNAKLGRSSAMVRCRSRRCCIPT